MAGGEGGPAHCGPGRREGIYGTRFLSVPLGVDDVSVGGQGAHSYPESRTQWLDRLVVRGAREHNLQGRRPRPAAGLADRVHRAVRVREVRLAFDTIFAEGQRRYVESLSSYARQFLGQMDKPDVDFIEGLSPGGLDRPEVDLAATRGRRSARSPRSTTTCGCCTPGSASRTARSAARRSQADPAADRRPGAGDARGHPVPGAGPGGPRAQGRVRRPVRRAAGQGYSRARVDGVVIR